MKYNSEVIKQKNETYSKCSVAILYIAYKWQPSLNKNYMHGNDVRTVESKITHSEKVTQIACKLIKDVGNKEEKTNKKTEVCPKLP